MFYDIEPKPVAWIGVDDVNDVESWKDSGAMRTIAEIVRHALSYKGGGYYGDYGGYDISLVKLDKPVSGSAPACLPGPIFKDAGVVAGLAGHGEYHREGGRTCQTDGHGQYKHKYCKTQGERRQVCNLNCNGKSKPPFSIQNMLNHAQGFLLGAVYRISMSNYAWNWSKNLWWWVVCKPIIVLSLS